MMALRRDRGAERGVTGSRDRICRFLFGLAIGLGLWGWADPMAGTDQGPITAENLSVRDDYWPHRVQLTSPWTPASGEAVGTKGVLMRVVSAEFARIDFGRAGIHDVPIAVTDLLLRSNEVREQGSDSRIGNLTRMIGRALGDPRHEPWRAYRRSKVAGLDILLVSAPLEAALLREMAEPLTRIDERVGVRVVLLVQGETSSEEIFRLLHEIGWTTPFLLQRHVQVATHGYLNEARTLPWLGLFTPNGRVLHQGPWPSDGDLEEFLDALAARRQVRD